MKKIVLFFVSLLAFTLLTTHASVDMTVQKAGPEAVIGIAIEDVQTGKIIYQHNADRLLIPASNLKLYSGAAALILLGPDYHFQTSLLTDAQSIYQGTLQGNLYIRFSGDPTLTTQNLEALLASLNQFSINRIQGNVIIVPPPFTNEAYAPGWTEEDKKQPYGAPVTPVVLDENVVKFMVTPTRIGQKARIIMTNPYADVPIENEVITRKKGQKNCFFSFSSNAQNQLKISGCIPDKSRMYTIQTALTDPMQYTQTIVRNLLKSQAIVLQGGIIRGQMPSLPLRQIGIHDSESLSVILANTLKPSNNLFANSLYLKVGETYWHNTATWQNSGEAVKRILQQYTGIPLNNTVIIDGCGLSRQNYVTPHQTTRLLTYMANQFPINDEFIDALPVAGQDGTLAKRRITNEQQERIRAKTGTMKGIVGLSGYVHSANHRLLAFSIMTNQTLKNRYLPISKYRGIEDEICRQLVASNVS